MSLETTVHSRIGALNGGRVYAVQAPANTPWPVIVWQRIDGVPVNTHEGPADFYQSRVQVTCYATTATQARTLREQVVAAMEANPDASSITVESKSEGYEDAAQVYRADADFFVWANN